MNWDQSNFRGLLIELGESEFGASPNFDIADSEFERWKSEGSPTDVPGWVRRRLSDIFPVAANRPVWPVRIHPSWQYHNGKPMVFLGQLELPRFVLSTGHKCTPIYVYVFGIPEGPPTGWKMIIKTVTLPASL